MSNKVAVTNGAAPAGIERTLLRIATGYRMFGAAWMVLLGLLVLGSSTEPAGRPGLVAASLLIVVAWTAMSTVLALRSPRLVGRWGFVVVDVAIGVFSVVVAVGAETIVYAGGYALAGVFGAIYAKALYGGGVAALALTGAALARLPSLPSLDKPNQVSIAISYLFAAAAAAAAVAVLRGNEVRRLTAEEALAAEQAARARSDDRAEVAAHLHDSVLQTLALIQRESTASEPVRSLARRQEHELRQWLYQAEPTTGKGLRDAINAMAVEVDELSATRVDAVVVGDRAMDSRHEALLRAGREAAMNAAKHANTGIVSLYAEVTPGGTVMYVKDRGSGFDPKNIPTDRRGIAESIVGRMERHGGAATITSALGAGTEVRLVLPSEEQPDE